MPEPAREVAHHIALRIAATPLDDPTDYLLTHLQLAYASGKLDAAQEIHADLSAKFRELKNGK